MSDAVFPPPLENVEFCVLARPGNALSTGQRWLFFGILAGFSLGVGLTLTAWGAWPVLPFTGVEIIVLALAFWYVERRSSDWERLVVAEDRVIIERSCRGHCETREFNRHWVQVELEDVRSAWPRQPRLALRFKGTAVEFGGMLPLVERARVARELKRVLSTRG